MNQLALFSAPVDERTLVDHARTILEAIDKVGALSVRDAGKIALQLRGFKAPALVQSEWLMAAGWRPLLKLRDLGLVGRRRDGRFERVNTGFPLIGRSPCKGRSPDLARPELHASKGHSTTEPTHPRNLPAPSDNLDSPEPAAQSAEGGLDGTSDTLEAASDDISHGERRYAHGCRCDVCRIAMRERSRRSRALDAAVRGRKVGKPRGKPFAARKAG